MNRIKYKRIRVAETGLLTHSSSGTGEGIGQFDIGLDGDVVDEDRSEGEVERERRGRERSYQSKAYSEMLTDPFFDMLMANFDPQVILQHSPSKGEEWERLKVFFLFSFQYSFPYLRQI